MAEKNKITIPKQQLEVMAISDLKPYAGGKNHLLPLKAKNLSLSEDDPRRDKPLHFTVFNKQLQDWIISKGRGVRFLADIQEVERPESEYGPDLNIVQIYDNGNPVSVRQGGARGGYYDSRSAEGIAAVQEVGAWLRQKAELKQEGIRYTAEDYREKYWQAVDRMLDNFLASPSSSDGYQTRQDAKSSGQTSPQVHKEGKTAEAPIKNVGDLLTRASKLDPPVSRADVCERFSVNDPAEITNLEEAWKQIQIGNKVK